MRLWPKTRRPGYYLDALAPAAYFARAFAAPRVPIFIYHDLEPVEFEGHLRFLAANGYATLTCADLPQVRDPGRRVMLSFDDGRRSVWSVAHPLLARYGFRGTAFVSPGIIPERGLRPSLADASPAALAAAHYGNDDLFSWEEAAVMQQSGVIDIQLHGFAHARIFASGRVVSFEHPGRADRNENVSAWQLQRGGAEVFVHRFTPGAPIYESASRWGTRPRYLDDPGVARACAEHVERHGGPTAFFGQRDWRAQLAAVVARHRETHGEDGRLETAPEKRRNLLGLLEEARGVLRRRLGIEATHFAVPWARGDPNLIADVAARAGIEHIYWAHLSRRHAAALPRDGPVHHARLKDIFLRRLPGRGSESVAQLVLGEYARIHRDRRNVRARAARRPA